MTVASKERASSLRRAHADKVAWWFGNRHWRVLTEYSGRTEPEPGIVIVYDQGEFWITGKGHDQEIPVFQTDFGHKGQHGFLVRETDADGVDLEPPVIAAFGYTQLETARDKYRSLTDLPRPRRAPPS